jgi:hypothetical protein
VRKMDLSLADSEASHSGECAPEPLISWSEGYGSSSQETFMPNAGRSSPLPLHVGRLGRARVRAPSRSPSRARPTHGQAYPPRVGRDQHSSSSSQSASQAERDRTGRRNAQGPARYLGTLAQSAAGAGQAPAVPGMRRLSTSSMIRPANDYLPETTPTMDLRGCASE